MADQHLEMNFLNDPTGTVPDLDDMARALRTAGASCPDISFHMNSLMALKLARAVEDRNKITMLQPPTERPLTRAEQFYWTLILGSWAISYAGDAAMWVVRALQ